MDPFETTGRFPGGTLRLLAFTSGRVMLTVTDATGHRGHSGVILQPGWLRPLAAWFAGEAEPITTGDDADLCYGPLLCVVSDEAAVVWSTHTWARLRCHQPYGDARVLVGPRDQSAVCGVALTPEARADVAAWLRRVDAANLVRPTASA